MAEGPFYFHSIWNCTIVLTLCSAIWWWSNFIWEKWLRMICNYGSLHANMWPLMAADGVCQALFPASVQCRPWRGAILKCSVGRGGGVDTHSAVLPGSPNDTGTRQYCAPPVLTAATLIIKTAISQNNHVVIMMIMSANGCWTSIYINCCVSSKLKS